MIDSGCSGILISPGLVQELAEALILLARDRERAKELGRRAAVHARSHFSGEVMVERVKEVYDQVLRWTSASPLLRKGEK